MRIGVVLAAVGALALAGAAGAQQRQPDSERLLVHRVLPLLPAAGAADVAPAPAPLAASPDFAVTVPGGPVTTAQLASGATVVRTTVSGGFDAAIALSVTGLPAGVTATFTPATIGAPGVGAATLRLAAGAGAPVGAHTITVRGTGNAVLRTVTTTLTITPYAPTEVTIFSDGFEGSWDDDWFTRKIGVNAGWGTSTYRKYAGAKSVYCAASGGAAAPVGGPYPANMSAWMAYGPFSLVGATAARASFRYKDTFQFMMSLNGTQWWGFKRSGTASSAWTADSLDLDDPLLPTSGLGQPVVYFAFIFESDGSVQYEGAYVDALTITKEVGGTPCTVACTAAVPATGAPGVWLQLEGTLNASSCGGTPTITWSFGDGTPASNAASPAHAWAAEGVFPWQMTAAMGGQTCVKDGNVTISSCSLTCGATVPAAWSPRSPAPFHATASAAGCAPGATFAWDFGDGAHAATADATHLYTSYGPRTWTLTVSAGGQTCVDSGTIDIQHPVRHRLE